MIRKAYYNLFQRIAKYRLIKSDVDVRCIHTHLLSTLLTGFLMWAYAFTAYYTISSPIPGIVGFTTSIIHLLSPLLFLVSNNVILITLIMLLSGVIHQGTFSYFTGGYESHILIWYGIIPMLAGIIAGLRTLLITGVTVFIIALVYLYLFLSGHDFPNLITDQGRNIAQALLVFGWIIVSASVVAYFLYLNKKIEEDLYKQKNKSDNLLQILLHDISNQIQVIGTSSVLIKKLGIDNQQLTLNTSKISSSCANINSVIHSVRSMYISEKRCQEIELKPVSLIECLNKAISINSQLRENKNITIQINCDDHLIQTEPQLFSAQVLSNLISNSLKFTDIGGKIIIETTKISNTQIKLVIKDNGIGMPKEILDNLFDMKANTTRLGTNKEKGTGLGMLIVKSILEMLNSDIKIKSTHGEQQSGTEFQIYLPVSS